MVSKSSSSDVSAPNYGPEPISDDDLIRGFILALGAGGRKSRTLFIYEDSIRKLSDFARSLSLSGLATMDRIVVRHWLSSLHNRATNPLLFRFATGPSTAFSGGALTRRREPTTQWTT